MAYYNSSCWSSQILGQISSNLDPWGLGDGSLKLDPLQSRESEKHRGPGILQQNHGKKHTVDIQNPAPPGMCKTL